jgi:hypothetical protein
MSGITWIYSINGKALLPPDAGVQMEFEDIMHNKSGRDEDGVMHRLVRRYRVGTWHFHYSTLTQEQYSYMLPILEGQKDFTFTYPDPDNPNHRKSTKAYIEKYGICWYSAKQGLYKNLKFDVVEY